ncbi:MAG: hypothetical protein PUC95_05180 [Gemmiger formicilis]|nr:hypothetical protein [Gemmiger formicilis]
MERQTALAEAIDTVADKAKYDRCAKKLLSFKAIDAWILKTCVKEFSLFSVDYISEHCMSGEVEISEHAVHQDELNRGHRINSDEQVTKMNSESSSINEGTVYYDVRFNAIAPENGESITLIINLEIQTDDKPGYELVTRGTYYCARMISEQHGTVFTGDHYEKIQKVYSIWICPSTPDCRKNGMFRYHTIEDPVFGDAYVKKENYDLMEVVILNLGEPDNEADCGILNLLNTLFSPTVLPDEKKKVLSEKYNIAMTAELESEVQRMCNLGTAIENKARDEGIDIGELRTTIKYYKKGKITIEEAAADLNMTVEEFKEKMNQIPAEAV